MSSRRSGGRRKRGRRHELDFVKHRPHRLADDQPRLADPGSDDPRAHHCAAARLVGASLQARTGRDRRNRGSALHDSLARVVHHPAGHPGDENPRSDQHCCRADALHVGVAGAGRDGRAGLGATRHCGGRGGHGLPGLAATCACGAARCRPGHRRRIARCGGVQRQHRDDGGPAGHPAARLAVHTGISAAALRSAPHRHPSVCGARDRLRRPDHLAEQTPDPMAAKDGHLMNIYSWFTDPANWTGSGGIPAQIGYHLLYSAIALLAALVIAVPLGILIGYTGRGEALVAGSANALRALPSLGLLVLLFLIISPVVGGKLVYVLPTIIVLVLLAIPPILTGTCAGIQTADPDAVGAARGMGFTKPQILLRVQLPCALPLMISGVRSSTLQIVSTATIAAYLGLQGLGRFILDGRAQANFAEMAGGAILVAVLAIVLEFTFAWLGRLIVSPGLRRTTAKSSSPLATAVPAPAAT